MSLALYLADDECMANARESAMTELSAGIAAIQQAELHIDALLQVDPEFKEGRCGSDAASHVESAIQASLAAYAVIHMIADRAQP